MQTNYPLALLLAGSLLLATSADACSIQTGDKLTPLLELYTSEGCSSCPPAEKWLKSKIDAPSSPFIPLVYHVDYWDNLGWKDPFADPAHAQRQRQRAAAVNSRTIYTPQFLLNGRDYRRGWSNSSWEKDIATPITSQARISLDVQRNAKQLSIKASANSQSAGHLYIALAENHLGTEVKAGENRGETLQHQFITRALYGPVSVQAAAKQNWEQSLQIPAHWKTQDLYVVAFVETVDAREILQATRLKVDCGD